MNNVKTQYDIYQEWNFSSYERGKFAKIFQYINNKTDPKIVDLAGGEGYLYELISRYKNDIDYTCVDFSDKQLLRAAEKGIKALKADLGAKFPFANDSFDIVIASEIIEHIFDTKFFLQECRRILKPDGVMILTTPNTASVGNRIGLLFGKRPGCIDYRVEGGSGHIRSFVKNELESLINESGFHILKTVGHRVNLPFINKKKKFYQINYFLGDMFPTLSNGFIVIADKRDKE